MAIGTACRCGGVRVGGKCDRCGYNVQNRLGGPWNRLYKLAAWKSLRLHQLAREPFCAICGHDATDCDHIVPHKGNLSIFMDANNLQSLCGTCHKRKTGRGE